MEHVEKLPVFKTIWSAHKQFFKVFFNIKSLLTFILPLFFVGALLEVATHYLGLEIYELELFAYTGEEISFDVLKGFILSAGIVVLIGLLSWIVSAFAAVGWHRMMILSENLKLNPASRGKYIKGYIKDALWLLLIGAFYYLIITITTTLLIASGGYILLNTIDVGNEYEWIESAFLPFTAFVTVLISIFLSRRFIMLSLCLPAAATGQRIKFKEIKSVFKNKWRLFFSSALTCLMPTVCLIAVIATVAFSEVNLDAENLDALSQPVSFHPAVTAFMMFLGVWMVYSYLSVLSMFYMHYVMPQLPEVLRKREELASAE